MSEPFHLPGVGHVPPWPARVEQVITQIAVDALIDLIALLTDPGACRYDHENRCQTHGLHERMCPHERAQRLLAKRAKADRG